MPLFDVLSSLFSTGVVSDLVISPAYESVSSANIYVNKKAKSKRGSTKAASQKRMTTSPSPIAALPNQKSAGRKGTPRKTPASQKASPRGSKKRSPFAFVKKIFKSSSAKKSAKTSKAGKGSAAQEQKRSWFGSVMDRFSPNKKAAAKSTSAKSKKGSAKPEEKRGLWGSLMDRFTPKKKYQTTSPAKKGKKSAEPQGLFASLKARFSSDKKKSQSKKQKKGQSESSWWDSFKKNDKVQKVSAFGEKAVKATKSLATSENFRKAAIGAGATILGSPDELLNLGGSLITGNYVGAASSAGRLLKKAFAPVAGIAAEHYVTEFGGSERLQKMVGAGVEAGVGVMEGENPLIAAGSTAAGVLAEHIATKRGMNEEQATALRGFTAAMASTGANKIEEAMGKKGANNERVLAEGKEQLKKIMTMMSNGMSEKAARAVVSAGMSGGTAAEALKDDAPKKKNKK